MTPVASVGNRTSEVCGEVLERLDAASELRVRVGGSGAELLSPRPPDDPGHLPVKQCVELWALGRVSDPRLDLRDDLVIHGPQLRAAKAAVNGGGGAVKIFLSSVRRGLEDERDALPALIRAMGHEPLRFEDFTAQPVPSREACLQGVNEADAYVLLLGERYGDALSDTGKAPTEEEWTVARRRGIPILAFRKQGVTPETAQSEFIARVENYSAGVFRGSFKTVADLLTAAAGAVRALEEAPPPLTWRPLAAPIAVPWEARPQRGAYSGSTILECHVLPIASHDAVPATILTELPRRLARAGRDHHLFGEERAVESTVREDSALVVSKPEGHERLAGIRVRRDRTVSLWVQLPSDMLGTIVDAEDIAGRTAHLLRLAADLDLSKSDEVALAVGLQGISMASEGSVKDLGKRTSASPAGFGRADDSAVVEPRDTVPSGALAAAADEIGRELAARLLLRFREGRR